MQKNISEETDMKRYTINKISRYLGISGEMLRHYERLGIISPQRMENGYRTYTALDVSIIMRMQFFHSCGFALRDCGDLINRYELQDLADTLENARENMRRIAQRAALISEEYDRIVGRIQDMERLLGRYAFETCPAFAFLPYRISDELLESADIARQLPKWLEAMPCVGAGPYFSIDEVCSHSRRYTFGLLTQERYMEAFNLSADPPVIRIPEQYCLTTIVMIPGHQPMDAEAVGPLLAYAEQNGYAPAGDIFGRSLTCTRAADDCRRYHQFWLPVTQKRY